MKLYDLINDYIEVLETDEIADTDKDEILSLIQQQIENKEIELYKVNRQYKSDIEDIDSEIKFLQAKKQARQNSYDRFKSYVKDCMDKLGVEKIKFTLGSLYFSKNKYVDIDDCVDINLLPDEFKKISVEPKKTELKKALENGTEIDGISLKTNRFIVFR